MTNANSIPVYFSAIDWIFLGFYFLEKNKNKKTNEKRKTQANE
jgi:hypothetical protein